MFTIQSVHFDNHIPNWNTNYEIVQSNILILVVNGCVEYTINGKCLIAEHGDLVFVPEFSKRAGETLPEGTHQKYTILFSAEDQIKASIPLLAQNKFIKYKIRNFRYIQGRFTQLYQELRGEEKHRPLIGGGILQELIGLISRDLENLEITPIRIKYVQTITSYLIEHYREPIEIEQLAKLILRSASYTTSLFKEVTGQTPIKYMHQLRIMEACNLLVHSNMTITNIANYLGYYDPSYFHRIFKKITSMSPSDYATQLS